MADLYIIHRSLDAWIADDRRVYPEITKDGSPRTLKRELGGSPKRNQSPGSLCHCAIDGIDFMDRYSASLDIKLDKQRHRHDYRRLTIRLADVFNETRRML